MKNIFLSFIIFCLVSCTLNSTTTKEKNKVIGDTIQVKNKDMLSIPKLETKIIDRELHESDYCFCTTNVKYPKLINGNDFCAKLSDSISQLVNFIITEHEEICDSNYEFNPELLEGIDDNEQSLYLYYNGGINNTYLSLTLEEEGRGLGSTFRYYKNHCFNFNIQTQQKMLISDFIRVDSILENRILTTFKNDYSFDEDEKKVLHDYLHNYEKVQYTIAQDRLIIYLNYIEYSLHIRNESIYLYFELEEIEDLLLVKKEDLPIFVTEE